MANEVERFLEFYNFAEEKHREWKDKAEENLRFFASQQWDRTDLAALRKEKRPSLTINKVKPIVEFLSGLQRQNKLGIGIMPRRRVKQAQTEILTEIIHQLLSSGNGDYHKSKCFWDGIVTGRGWLGCEVNYDDDPVYGDIVVKRVSPFQITYDPNSSEYDLSDAEFIIKEQWVSVEKLMIEFPEKADEIPQGEIDYKEIQYSRSRSGGDYEGGGAVSLSKLPNRRVKVRECWFKEVEPVWYLVIPPNEHIPEGVMQEADNKEDLEAIIAGYPELQASGIKMDIVKRSKKRLRLATTVGNVLLQLDNEPFGPQFNIWPFVPFFPYKVDRVENLDDTEMGVIDDIKDPQREINKRRSQQLHIINTMAHSGWINKTTGGADKKQLEQFGSKPGVVIEYDSEKPEQIIPKPASNAHWLAEEKAADDIKEITLVNPDLLGYRGERGEPGVVLQLRQQQGMVGLEPLLDNFRYTTKLLGHMLCDVVLKTGFYTPDEVLNIIDLPENQQEAEVKTAATMELFNDTTFKKFNVQVQPEPTTPTQRLLNFRKLLEVAQILAPMGLMIPPDILLDASDVPYKDEIKARLMQMQQQVAEGQQINPGEIDNILKQMDAGSPMPAEGGTGL